MNSQNVPLNAAMLLDAVGGEPLAGSGFEKEQPEPGFGESEPARDETGPSTDTSEPDR